MKSALDKFDEIDAASGEHIADRPERDTFEDFLLNDARVPIGGGEYGRYTFEGREAIVAIVRRIDSIIGSAAFAKARAEGREPTAKEIVAASMPDALLGVAGGAQWGKTILELNLAAYLTGQRFLNAGLFLPSSDLVDGVVDTKFRPDVLDRIPWFADMTQLGKAINRSGKAANRKGAFLVTDGRRRANGMVLGLQKIPTTFSFDVTLQDEVDDIPEKNARFVRGRRTASDLRFDVRIGTQRIHGRGQNKVWKDGSQGVVVFGPIGQEVGTASDEVLELPEGWINPEEAFPEIIRHAVSGSPQIDDPALSWSGDFKRGDVSVSTHSPENIYYLAHPTTGAPLNRRHPLWFHRSPERFKQRRFTYRAAQLDFDAIGLSQIVSQFTDEQEGAVSSSEAMTVFRCDVLALPQSTSQALEPSILDRARNVDPFGARMRLEENRSGFAGLDVGDRCYFFTRERETRGRKRLVHAATIAASDMVGRSVSIFHELKLSALFVDQRPLVSQSRSVALILNELDAIDSWPTAPSETNKEAYFSLPGGLIWDGRNRQWRNLKCAVVRFDKKQIGAGIEQGFDIFEEGGVTKFVPLIRCNRYETIDRAVREFLTPAESIVEVVDGAVRETPAMLLPSLASAAILPTVDAHLITGSEREKEEDGSLGDYVDQVANHFLLADGYSALAELVAGETGRGGVAGPIKAFQRGGARTDARRSREVVA